MRPSRELPRAIAPRCSRALFAAALLCQMLVAIRVVPAHAQSAETSSARQPEHLTSWTRPTFPPDEYEARRAAARSRLGDNDILLVPSADGTSGGETFRQRDDFEYFVGLEIPRSILAVDGRSGRSLLFVPRTDTRFENSGRANDFPGRAILDDTTVRSLSRVDTVLIDSALDEFLFSALNRGARVLVNLERPGDVTASAPNAFRLPSAGEVLVAALQREHAEITLGNAYPLVAHVRMIKSAREIVTLRAAARDTRIAIARGAAQVRPGVDERTLAGRLTADCLALGSQRDAFAPIIKSGPNSLWAWRILGAHYDRRNRVMRSGDLVIYDVGCERDHYVSDVGRTFPVDQQFTPRQRELVEMVRTVSDAIIAAARPGVTLADLQAAARAAIPASAARYMQAPLFFGHHIGLTAGDPSLPEARLAAGMVFTVEPWYYNHDEGIAVFLEDEILITPQGSENLTAALPRDAAGLERLRRGLAPELVAPPGAGAPR